MSSRKLIAPWLCIPCCPSRLKRGSSSPSGAWVLEPSVSAGLGIAGLECSCPRPGHTGVGAVPSLCTPPPPGIDGGWAPSGIVGSCRRIGTGDGRGPSVGDCGRMIDDGRPVEGAAKLSAHDPTKTAYTARRAGLTALYDGRPGRRKLVAFLIRPRECQGGRAEPPDDAEKRLLPHHHGSATW